MARQVVTRTYRARICNYSQVREDLDSLGFAAGAENIRHQVLPNLADERGDRDTGWLAQPAVRLFDRSGGRFAPREQVTTREP